MSHAYPLFSPIPRVTIGTMFVLQPAVERRIEIVGLAVGVWAHQIMTPVRLMNDTLTDL